MAERVIAASTGDSCFAVTDAAEMRIRAAPGAGAERDAHQHRRRLGGRPLPCLARAPRITRARCAAASGATLILIATLAACTASPTDAPPLSASSEAPSSADAALTIDPLSAYITPDMSKLDEDTRKQDEMVQQCMQAEGFEYTVVVPPPQIPDEGTPFLFIPERKWAEQHGYGMVETTFSPPTIASDPNLEYTAGLSPSERKAYERAMYGESVTGDKDSSELPVEKTGCYGKAAAAFSPDQSTRPAILDDAGAFVESLATKPEVTAINDEWAACFLEAGYPADAARTFTAKIQKYLGDHPADTTAAPAVRDFRSEEIEMATADLKCKEDLDFLQRTLRALAELEKDYITKHKKELEEASLWLNQ